MAEISVIIPSYNHARYIERAVSSVLSQTHEDLELIIVDDGSTDHSLQVLGEIHDSRMKVLEQPNLGAHAAINNGLREARGDYLSILNSDDYYAPERLEKIITVLKNHPEIGLASSHLKIIDENDLTLGIKHGYQDCEPWLLDHPESSFRAAESLKDALLTENYLATTSNFMFPRRILGRVGDFRPLRFTHDWDFALRVSKQADLALVEEPLLSYRVHAQNTIREDLAAMIFEICWILAMHLPDDSRQHWSTLSTSPEKHIEQLLNSIYTYGCDRVLNVLLLQRLVVNQEHALALLSPENAERLEFMKYIHSVIEAPEPAGQDRNLPPLPARIKMTVMRRIRKLWK